MDVGCEVGRGLGAWGRGMSRHHVEESGECTWGLGPGEAGVLGVVGWEHLGGQSAQRWR